jgi:hypothetical protein
LALATDDNRGRLQHPLVPLAIAHYEVPNGAIVRLGG